MHNSKLSLLSMIELNTFIQDNVEEIQINSMKDELNQTKNSATWELLPRPKGKKVIGTKWVSKNKLNENGEVVRNNY